MCSDTGREWRYLSTTIGDAKEEYGFQGKSDKILLKINLLTWIVDCDDTNKLSIL